MAATSCGAGSGPIPPSSAPDCQPWPPKAMVQQRSWVTSITRTGRTRWARHEALHYLPGPLAENAVVAMCALADAAGLERWSSGAVEDAATALEVLAGALSDLSPEAAELLEIVPAAVAALREQMERATAVAVPSGPADRAEDSSVLSPGPRRAPRRPPRAPAPGCRRRRGRTPLGSGSAETAAASLTFALAAYGPGTYARVLASG